MTSLQELQDLVRETLASGVVGMNFRNRQLVERLNPRREISLARDKIATKVRLQEEGVTVARTIGVIRQAREIKPVYEKLCAEGCAFVVKPARSAQGRGILLCRHASPEGVTKLNGDQIPTDTLLFHFHQILHGEFSFGRPDDAILIEGLLETDKNWILPDLPGAPDLRIILSHGRLLMAMARLPTSVSDGRANLHCGAVGAGINLDSGLTRGGVQFDKLVDHHPDTGHPLAGNHVQDFDICLELARKCEKAFQLGYIGIDLMRDKQMGPVVLEVNARPGLALQIANRTGLFSEVATPASNLK